MLGKDRRSDDLVDDVVEVCRTLVPHRVEWSRGEVTREMVEALLRGHDEAGLSNPDARRDLTGPLWTAGDIVEGRPVRDPTRALAAKVALVTADIRAGRTERVQPCEGRSVARALGLEPPGDRPSDGTVDPGDGRPCPDAPVEFAFPWRPSPVRTTGRLGTATAHAALTTVDGADAPVACSLWTPQGRIEARLLGTRWLRPVLSPESWRPIDVAGFRAAASDGRAWRDNPFLPRTGRCCPTFDLGDLAAPRTLAKGDERRIATARDACLARAGQLLVVGGIVHKLTDAPLAGIGTVFLDGAEASGSMWVMGDLCSASSMDTLGHEEGPAAFWFNRTAVPEPHGPDDRSAFARGEGLLSASAWVSVSPSMSVPSPHLQPADGPWPGDASDLVEGLDVATVSDASACLRVAARHAGRLSLVAPWSRRDTTDPWVALRERLETLAAACDAGMGELDFVDLKRVAEDVLARSTQARDALAGMWTYVATISECVATHELALRQVDDEVAAMRL